MRSAFWTIIVCIVLVAAIGIYTNVTTKNIVDIYLEKVTELTALVKEEKIAEAEKMTRDIKAQWLEDCQSLQVIAFHQDTNKVDSYIYMLEAGFESGDQGIIFWALHELTESFENIYTREDISLVNIF